MSSHLTPLYPSLSPASLEAVEHAGTKIYEPKLEWLRSLLEGAASLQSQLADTPLEERLRSIEEAGRVWREKLDAGNLGWVKEELVKATGYSPPLVEMELEFVLEVLNAENIRRMLDHSIIGGAASLEAPVEVAPGEYVRTLPAGPALIIGSGNSLIPPLIPATASLAVGNFTILRPSLANFRAVAEALAGLLDLPEDNPMRRALLVAYFPHESKTLKALLEQAPLGVVNYWGGEPGRTIISRTVAANPNRPRFVQNGPMTGFAVVDGESASREVAEKLALEVVLYEQQLCSSPTQAAFIGTPQEAREFAAMLAEALDRVGAEYPLHLDSIPYPLFVLRRTLELAGARVLASDNPKNPWTLVLAEGSSALGRVPRSSLIPLYARRRFLEIVAVDSIEQALRLIASLPGNPAYAGVDRVQTLAVAVSRERLEWVLRNLYRLGVYRVVPLGESYLRTPAEPYDGSYLPSAFTYTAYVRVRGP